MLCGTRRGMNELVLVLVRLVSLSVGKSYISTKTVVYSTE